MNRLLSMIVVGAVSAAAAYSLREWMQRSQQRRVTWSAHPALDTWEYEGGNLAPHEQRPDVASHATRPLQQQLG
ncbi:MAG TPA: hypothetical protein VGI14_09345 [Casimicrobiaceae bacterium]|jgi:hypothetical protein